MTIRLSAQEIRRRSKELRPIRDIAFEIWKQNPDIKEHELRLQLQENGYASTGIGRTTIFGWLHRWNENKHKSIEPTGTSSITFEQIVQAAPDIETLSVLVFQGMLKVMEDKDAAFETVKQDNLQLQGQISELKSCLDTAKRERNRLMAELNEKIARGKIGIVTLDRIKHRIIPKM